MKQETATEIYNRLVKQKSVQLSEPFILVGVEKIVNTQRSITLRAMLLNDSLCPLYDYMCLSGRRGVS